MGQFSVEKPLAPGSVLSGNQHRRQPGDDTLLPGACERKGGDQALMHVKVGPGGGASREAGSPTRALRIAV